MKKLKAIYNAVIVKPVEAEEKTHGNIIVPDLGHEKNKLGEVVAIGDGHYSATGKFLETVLNIGDIVILPTMGFSKMEFEGEEYWLGPENQILGVIEDDEKSKQILLEQLPF